MVTSKKIINHNPTTIRILIPNGIFMFKSRLSKCVRECSSEKAGASKAAFARYSLLVF